MRGTVRAFGVAAAFPSGGAGWAATGQPGFLAAEVQLQLDDEQHVLVTSSWASTDHFERWLASPAWPDLVGQIRGLVSGKPDIRAYRVVDVVEATP